MRIVTIAAQLKYSDMLVNTGLMRRSSDSHASEYMSNEPVLPVLLAKQLRRARTKFRRVLFFVLFCDNEVAKFACTSMYSESTHSRAILQLLILEELDNQSWTWYSRVPSRSNRADAASRLKPQIMVAQFSSVQVSVSIPKSILGLVNCAG